MSKPHEIMPLTDEQAQALLAGLEQLKGGQITERLFGICSNLSVIVDFKSINWDVADFVCIYAQNWEYYSGEDSYPVIGQSHYMLSGDLWVGEGGELRYNLINYLISLLEERLYCSKP